MIPDCSNKIKQRIAGEIVRARENPGGHGMRD
ncbi:MAG: hypothetical protein JWQ36_398, partial [Enterovirga sp.]|nr:hypothetical protein [Enterovirga sp.]